MELGDSHFCIEEMATNCMCTKRVAGWVALGILWASYTKAIQATAGDSGSLCTTTI